MKILSSKQIREADAYTIANEPIASIDLMERAATAAYEWMKNSIFFNKNRRWVIFCGTGNNGGDGLAIARKLNQDQQKVIVFAVRISEKSSDDFQINENRLKEIGLDLKDISSKDDLPEINENDIVVDAIFGSGLSRPVEGLSADLIRHINESSATTVAIDIPSGLFADSNSTDQSKAIIEAGYTLSFQFPKLAFMFPENEKYVAEFRAIPIGLDEDFIARQDSQNYFITKKSAISILKPRSKFSHKGTYGHALLVSGSYGKMGATVLAARACLRTGAGLLTIRAPKCGYEIMQTTVPEAMCDVDESESFLTSNINLEKYNAIGIGPGIGTEKETQNMLKLFIQNSALPLVVDADAINILSENKTWLSFVPKNSIYTPHPKEFERLVGFSKNNFERHKIQIEFAKKHQCYVVLKGAHTAIACPDGEVYFNSTGNSGMATGGSGDVLTGIITGLMAQGYSSKEASILGVYMHGLMGDIAAQNLSEESLMAGDIVFYLADAFKYLQAE
ncbi:MAG: bifunctional ADP-dependent NAD(P)H-hydrate dehydratase/NAD(P)H-hydrate epimerase [Flavobacteriales bacterium]|nr:MAG: bifunctional ADP-dependent NAD(P)H-hydrate dehydratase/NAD(P)H-hydrate epimerase [Flavobacteriales bacterium]